MSAEATWESAVRWLMAQPDQQQLVRDCYFDPPLVQAAARFAASAEWRAIRSFLPRGGMALDLGAGNGIASFALGEAGFRVVAVEPDRSELVGAGAIRGLGRTTNLPLHPVRTFGETIPLRTASIDVTLARQVLHHAYDLPALCRELFRITRPGGILIAARDHVISGPEQLPAFLAAHPLHRLYGGENAFRRVEYERAFRAAGFRIERRWLHFDSPVNYAPHTPETLRAELQSRLAAWPGGRLAGTTLEWEPLFRAALWALSRVDRRPGRLVSYVCRRPG